MSVPVGFASSAARDRAGGQRLSGEVTGLPGPPGIFLALSPGAIHPAPVQAAFELAAAHELTLAVSVLPAERYAQAATLSFTREFRLSCGIYRDFGPGDVQLALAGQMRRLTRYLERAGRDRAVQWVLDAAPRPLAAMLREYRDAGVMTLVDSAPWLAAAGRNRGFAQVVVLLDDSLAALPVAAIVCRAVRSRLCLVGLAPRGIPAGALREAIAEGLREQGLAAQPGQACRPVFVGSPDRAGAHLADSLGGHSSLVVARAADLALAGLSESGLARRVGTAVLALP